MDSKIPLETEESLILGILRTLEDNIGKEPSKQTLCRVTPRAWREYANHASEKVREATRIHPLYLSNVK